MDRTSPPQVRKRLLQVERTGAPGIALTGQIDLANCATIAYSSEHPDSPVDHLLDAHSGPGGTRWAAAQPDSTERIVIEFDEPRDISWLTYEVEERELERTQEVSVEASSDGGRNYSQVLRQEYTFSPRGATFQHEDLRVNLRGITHLRLTIVPNKGGPGTATLTSLRLFAS